MRERVPRRASEPQFVNGSRERARKPRRARNRREVLQLAVFERIEGRTRGHRFGVRRRARHTARGSHRDGSRARGELQQAETMKAERVAIARDRAREVVGGAAGGGHDEQFGVG